jgi:hypothetical protein
MRGHKAKMITTEITEDTKGTEEEKTNEPQMNTDEHG